MKEIKFRTWNKKDKKMQLISVKIQRMSYHNELILCPSWGYDYGNMTYNNDSENFSELMQFTGVFDKDGKEIYEGDIIQNDWKDVFKIDFIEGAFVLHEDDGLDFFFNQDDSDRLYDCLHLTVIGNIYQNPELFTEQSK